MYDLQTNYPGIAYRDKQGKPAGATIASGGCCPTSVGNILRNLCGISAATTRNVCTLATSSGARYNGGTTPSTLLAAALKKWGGFTYACTTSDSAMQAHVKAGGMALAHTPGSSGGATALFSTGGHFVSIIDTTGSKMKVCDPYWYSGKWSANSIRKSHITTTGTKGGVVYADYSAISSACDYYYLIQRKIPKVTTKSVVTARSASRKISKRVGTIDKGVTLTVLDKTTNWIQTAVWVAKKYCTISGSKAKLTADVNARDSNGTNSVKLGTLNKGASLVVLKQTENWIKVPIWVAKKYTK